MTKRNTNRLLAGVLTLVMVFSLCEVSLGQSAKVKAATTLQNPTMDGVVSTWDCIYFGNYYQNSNTFKVPIKWRVLSVEGDDAFLLADKNLDVQSYNEEYKEVTWETCTLRKWLNGTFLDTAFTAEEQAAIKDTTVVNDDNPAYGTEGGPDTIDKVYLLSIAEASNTAYGFYHLFQLEASDTRVVKNTLLVADKVKTDTGSEPTNWWLRSPGTDIGHCAADVHQHGDGCQFGEAVSFKLRVRPVLHLNLSETALWQYAGKVSSNGDVEEPTPTAAVSAPPATASPAATAAPSLSSGGTTPSDVNNNDGNISKNSDNKLLSKVVLKAPKNKKGKKVVASWNAVEGAKGYQVQYAANRNFKKKNSVSTKKTTYTIKKLKKNKTYYIRVRAYNTNGTKKAYGQWSKVRKVKVKK